MDESRYRDIRERWKKEEYVRTSGAENSKLVWTHEGDG